MSAPTSGSADANPGAGYYPDPSIPGYIRYWNGASWVPGTSRPAPQDGEAMPSPPPGSAPARTGTSAPPDETGPMFFDEDPGPVPEPVQETRDDAALPEVRQRGEVDVRQQPIDWDDPQRLHGGRPEPAASWNVDAGLQSGFGGDAERRVSWGMPPAADAAAAELPEREPESGAPERRAAQPGGTVEHGGTMAIRMPPSGRSGGAAGSVPPARQSGSAAEDGTMAIRAQRPAAGDGGASGSSDSRPAYGYPPPRTDAPADGTMAIRMPGTTPPASATPQGRPAQQPGVPPQQHPGASAPQQQPQQQPGYGYPQAAPTPPQPPHPSTPAERPAWARQGHLPTAGSGGAPGAPEGVVPWRPPVSDPFLQAAQEHASARPASLGRRLAARLVDTLLLAVVVGAAAVPLGTQAVDHINEKIEAAKLSGRTVTVWLLDGTTTPLFGIVLGVFLLAGLLLEVLPVAKWGRSPGKRLCGVRVLAIEANQTPGFGAAMRRWLVYGGLGLLGIGVVNVLWCLVDRPWRQCWHDKAARTFVAGS